MRTILLSIVCCSVLLPAGCRKDSAGSALPVNSVAIQAGSGKDTLQVSLPIASDSAFVIGVKAALTGAASSADHWVTFQVDTTKIAEYRSEYGSAVLLPTSCYYFYKSMTRIPAGSTVSDSAQLNIILQTKLDGYSTYILPVIIQSVDGNADGIATEQVLYYVLQTGKPSVITRTGWTIAGYSSAYANTSTTYPASNVLDDNNTSTMWVSDLAGKMPQWVAISFNKTVTFSSVTYYFPTAYTYPAKGGYPTSIQIETSTDGTNWDSKGVFAGNIVSNMQTIPVGLTTAKYLRFTSLASVKYSATYECIFISGIMVNP